MRYQLTRNMRTQAQAAAQTSEKAQAQGPAQVQAQGQTQGQKQAQEDRMESPAVQSKALLSACNQQQQQQQQSLAPRPPSERGPESAPATPDSFIVESPAQTEASSGGHGDSNRGNDADRNGIGVGDTQSEIKKKLHSTHGRKHGQ